jgi:glycosyltransferase involved in cell wall biosynthesis
MPRHVGINAVFLRPRMGGLETYVKQLVPEMLRARPGMRVSVFVSPEGQPVLAGEPWASEVDLVTHPLLGLKGLKAVSELTLLGALAPRRGVDLLHSVALTGPVRTKAAHVVTLADVTWLVAPDPADRATIAVWRAIVPPVARAADRIIAISQAGADHVTEHLRVPAERIDVVYPGHGVGATTPPTPEPQLRERLGLGDGPIVLTVSAKRVHKNLIRLIEAHAAVRERVPGAVLVLPGNPTEHEAELKARAAELGMRDAVAFPAYVDAADLEGLYAASSAFAFASTNEGFGLPILEAQARGVPVACSNVSSLPEAAGDGALLFDPLDAGDIAAKLVRIITEPATRVELVSRGQANYETFTWTRSAEQTLESYDRAIHAREQR